MTSPTAPKPPAFEQAMLEKAFIYSIDDQLENTDKVIRALKGVLVQKKVRVKFADTHENMMQRLETLEKQPIPGIKKDIYSVCNWLRSDTHEVVIWQDGQPCGRLKAKKVRDNLRDIMDELNRMSGELCTALDIQPFSFKEHGKRKIFIPSGRREQDEA